MEQVEERTLTGHKGIVAALLFVGGRLVSGSYDRSIRVWDVGTGRCCIRVWSLDTWGLERTLKGHGWCVTALVASGGQLISSSCDRTVRVWSVETWECVQTVEVYPAELDQCIKALAVCGWALVGGSMCDSGSEECEVRVWDLETLLPLHTLRQPAGDDVQSMVWDGREVWVAVGEQVVVWGRRGVGHEDGQVSGA